VPDLSQPGAQVLALDLVGAPLESEAVRGDGEGVVAGAVGELPPYGGQPVALAQHLVEPLEQGEPHLRAVDLAMSMTRGTPAIRQPQRATA
jgi:hypothetical protein